MNKNETTEVNAILVRNSYKFENNLIKPDDEGDLVTFGIKPTNEVVKEIMILYNQNLELSEVHRLLKKVVNEIENKMKNENWTKKRN